MTPRADPDLAASPVTEHLAYWTADPKASLDRILPWVARELRRMAQSFLDDEAAGHTLQATALVHELYLRLLDRRSAHWRDRSHFFGFAARTMRRILVDHARARRAEKRGGCHEIVSIHEQLDAAETAGARALDPDAFTDRPPLGAPLHRAVDGGAGLDLVALDDALCDLERLDPRLHQVVELRFFAGATIAEVAEILGVGTATVQRDWASARAWLQRELAAPESVDS